MDIIIDRFEGEFAVVEIKMNGKISIINLDKRLIPEGATEGSIISITNNCKETENKRKKIQFLMDDLWK